MFLTSMEIMVSNTFGATRISLRRQIIEYSYGPFINRTPRRNLSKKRQDGYHSCIDLLYINKRSPKALKYSIINFIHHHSVAGYIDAQ